MEERRIYDEAYVKNFRRIENLTVPQWKEITREWDNYSKEIVKEARANCPEARADKAWLLYKVSRVEKDKQKDFDMWKSIMLNLMDDELDRIIRSFY